MKIKKTELRLGLFIFLIAMTSCQGKEPVNENQQPLTHISQQPADDNELTVICQGGTELLPCLDKEITVKGFLAGSNTASETTSTAQPSSKDIILQHPIEANFNEKQSYMRLSEKYGQLVLISQESIACSTKISVTGQLTQKVIECPEDGSRGKCPYSNYFIQVKNWSCENK